MYTFTVRYTSRIYIERDCSFDNDIDHIKTNYFLIVNKIDNIFIYNP